MVFAFSSCRRGTMFGIEESLAGPHTSERHSMKNDNAKMAASAWRNGIDAYMTPRAMSAVIMRRLRSIRSTSTPANGPNRIEGRRRDTIMPATAKALAAGPLSRLETSAATATKPTQSPSDDTVIAAISLEKVGWRNRSFRVAGLVPRRAAMSSATLATGGVEPTAWEWPAAESSPCCRGLGLPHMAAARALHVALGLIGHERAAL